MGTLEIISIRKPDEAEAEWAWVMKELGLGPEYFLAVYEVIRQGRWREAENPGGYLKTAARREARELTESGERKPRGLRGYQGLMPRGKEIPASEMAADGMGHEELLDYFQQRKDSGKPTPDPDNVWRSLPGWGSDHEGLLRHTPVKRRRRRK